MVSERIVTVVATLVATTLGRIIVGWLWEPAERVKSDDNDYCPIEEGEGSTTSRWANAEWLLWLFGAWTVMTILSVGGALLVMRGWRRRNPSSGLATCNDQSEVALALSQPWLCDAERRFSRNRRLGEWTVRTHRQTIAKLEFEIVDPFQRVRALTAHFDETTPFGDSMTADIRSVCVGYTGGGPLPPNTKGAKDDVASSGEEMWKAVVARLERLHGGVEDVPDRVQYLVELRRGETESALAFVNRCRVVYFGQCEGVSMRRAMNAVMTKLEPEFVSYLRNNADYSLLDFEELQALATRYHTWSNVKKPRSSHRHHIGQVGQTEDSVINPFDADLVHPEGSSYQQREGEAVNMTKKVADDAGKAKQFHGYCFRCGKYGHRKRDCKAKSGSEYTLPTTNTATNAATMKNSTIEERLPLLHLTVSLGQTRDTQKKTRMLVDTGAARSVIPLRLARKQGWLVDPSGAKSLQAFNGQVERTSGVTDLWTTIGRETRKVEFEVSASASHPLIGKPTLTAFGAIIDCVSDALRIENGELIPCSAVKAQVEAESEDQEGQPDKNNLMIREDETRSVKPFRRENAVFLPLGRSLVLKPMDMTTVQLPYSVLNEEVLLSGSGNLPAGVAVIGATRQRGVSLKVHFINLSSEPQQLGAKNGAVGFLVPQETSVFLHRVSGEVVPIDNNRPAKRAVIATCTVTEELQEKFPEVLREGIGMTTHYAVTDAGLRENVDWSRLKLRVHSQAECDKMRPMVRDLLDLDVIETVKTRPTVVTPMIIVTSPNGKSRLVHDFRLLNAASLALQANALDRMKTIESIPKREIWSSMDLAKGYMQIPLDESIRQYFGFELQGQWYRFKRVPFGWIHSGTHFTTALNMTMAEIVPKLPPDAVLRAYVDDILLGTQTEESHDAALVVIFQALSAHGWCCNPQKIRLKRPAVEFLGIEIGRDGLRPSSGLIKKLSDLDLPNNTKELRVVFGLLNQLSRFQGHQHAIIAPLRQFQGKPPGAFKTEDFRRVWNEVIERAQTEWRVLSFPQKDGKWTVISDASSTGYGAVLLSDEKPVAMFSKSSSKTWAHSSEAEIDAILLALRAFEGYISHCPVEVYTDNWAAFRAMSPDNCSPIVLRRLDQILQFNPSVKFIPGVENAAADLLSRSTYLQRRIHAIDSPEVTTEKVPTLRSEHRGLIEDIHNRGHIGPDAVAEELRRRGKSYKGMFKDIRSVLKSCDACQRWQKRVPQESLGSVEATRPAQIVGIDFMGPFRAQGRSAGGYVGVAIDGLTRFVETVNVPDTSIRSVMKLVQHWINRHSTPETIISDAGAALRSSEFRSFCDRNQIRHVMAAPHHQASNGLVERAIQTLLRRVRRMMSSGKSPWRRLIPEAVRIYNATKHSVTGYRPTELMFGLEDSEGNPGMALDEARRQAVVSTRQQRMYRNHRRPGRRLRPLEVGSEVLVYLHKGRRKFDPWWSGPHVITARLSSRRYVVSRNGRSQVVHGDDLVKYWRREACERQMLATGTDVTHG